MDDVNLGLQGLNVDKSGVSGLFYGWRNDGSHDIILDLGTMKKAVIIRKSINNFWFISEGSFFPFSSDIYLKKFNTVSDAKTLANSMVSRWLNDTILALNL